MNLISCTNLTTIEIEQATRVSNHHVVGVTTLSYMFDIRGWIAPHLDEIRYHTEPHIFLFKKCPTTGHAVMYYKHWSHDAWEPDGGLLLLKVRHRNSTLLSMHTHIHTINVCRVK